MGGILSCGNALIRNCGVVINGYDACRGYAHNGGLVGMFYLYDKQETPRPISWCSVNGFITFFEDNRDRRAYCEPFVGELLTWTELSNCSSSSPGTNSLTTQPSSPRKSARPPRSPRRSTPPTATTGAIPLIPAPPAAIPGTTPLRRPPTSPGSGRSSPSPPRRRADGAARSAPSAAR